MAKRVLKEEYVLGRSNRSSLEQVTHLNLWGNELADVSVVGKMPKLKVLSLSFNEITSLEVFQHCKNLEELYLRKNKVGSLEEVLHLADLPKLKVLWLCENPCAEESDYRFRVLSVLPNLEKLDSKGVDSEELEESRKKKYMIIRSQPKIVETVKIEEQYSPPPQRRRETYQVHEEDHVVIEPKRSYQPQPQPKRQYQPQPQPQPKRQYQQQRQPQPQPTRQPKRQYQPQRRQYDYVPEVVPEEDDVDSLPPPFELPLDLPPVVQEQPPLPQHQQRRHHSRDELDDIQRGIRKMTETLSSRYLSPNRGSSSQSSASSASSSYKGSILVAVLTLIRELDPDQLMLLKNEIDNIVLLKKSNLK